MQVYVEDSCICLKNNNSDFFTVILFKMRTTKKKKENYCVFVTQLRLP